jgi:aminomethyltransferase
MRTALYDRHVASGAKIIDFSGWEMPVQYEGIIQEHKTVRHHVGIFDVSHMGRVLINGKDAAPLLDYLSTNYIANKAAGTATYTVWCSEDGYCVDDLIIYKQNVESFFAVFNASNRQKDLNHLKQYAQGYEVVIADRFKEDGIIAIQGPKAIALVSAFFQEVSALKPMQFISIVYQGQNIVISRTGYTGADGIEIYASHAIIVDLWDLFLKEGRFEGIKPIGLGARDTLRLEMGYALYGHELSASIAPSESVAFWTIKWDKDNFLGKKSLQKLQEASSKRMEYGIVLKDKGVAREGYAVYDQGVRIGKVTSGTMSPSLNQSIALIITDSPLHPGSIVDVAIRQNMCKAEVVALPFYKPVA